MRNARAVIAGVLTILVTGLVAGCGSSSTTPTPPSSNGTSQVKFTATLLPANEVPSIASSDPEGNGTGTATITLNVTRDTAGNIIAATADFQVSLSGFPSGTPINLAHIHPGAAGQNGSPLVDTLIRTGDVVLANGSGSFTKTGLAVSATDATAMVNTPANYYFNVHSALHSGGVARGQMVKQ
jgi:CHRD domain